MAEVSQRQPSAALVVVTVSGFAKAENCFDAGDFDDVTWFELLFGALDHDIIHSDLDLIA